jgi:hypothetical protein
VAATYLICTRCGAGFHARADARFRSNACRQRAHHAPQSTAAAKPAATHPVPRADALWGEERFWIPSREPGVYAQRELGGADDAELLENYVYTVASIGGFYLDEDNGDAFVFDTDPLPDALPRAITPETAAALAGLLAGGIDRAQELLALLTRRSREANRP